MFAEVSQPLPKAPSRRSRTYSSLVPGRERVADGLNRRAMHVVYFSHSYRPEDAEIVEHFGQMMRSEELLPSLDPPSKTYNAAKLERQMLGCDGMVVVLTDREGGVSQNIMFEIVMCLRSQKPLLVFVEDTLPSAIVPPRILQRRFSRRSYLREMREHLQAFNNFKFYLTDRPRYQMGTTRRACLFVGFRELAAEVRREIVAFMDERSYDSRFLEDLSDEMAVFDAMNSCRLSVRLVDDQHPYAHEVAGATRAACLPQIAVTSDPHYPFDSKVPIELQPLAITELPELPDSLAEQLDIFEQDFIELRNGSQADAYRRFLLTRKSLDNSAEADARKVFFTWINGPGAVGDGANVSVGSITYYEQIWEREKQEIGDLPKLAEELEKIEKAANEQHTEEAKPTFTSSIRDAVEASRAGNGPLMLKHLAKAGEGSLGFARVLGLELAAKAIAAAIPGAQFLSA